MHDLGVKIALGLPNLTGELVIYFSNFASCLSTYGNLLWQCWILVSGVLNLRMKVAHDSIMCGNWATC